MAENETSWGLDKRGTEDEKLMPVGFWTQRFPDSYHKFSHSEKLTWTLYVAFCTWSPDWTEPNSCAQHIAPKAWLKMSAEELAGSQMDEKVLAWKWYINTREASGSSEPALLAEEVNKLEVEPPTCANKFVRPPDPIGVKGPQCSPKLNNAWFTDRSVSVTGDQCEWRAAAFNPATSQALTATVGPNLLNMPNS